MKSRSIILLLIAEIAAMSLWFVSAAVLPEMLREVTMSPMRQAALSAGVQAGFVIGAIVSAVFGLADRFDPRRVFAISAISAGAANALLLVVQPGGDVAILARILTGALLAGVYPVGMKIMVGWGQKDRGFLVGALVGALTLGSALPHLIALSGGANWRLTVAVASLAAIGAGLLGLLISLGPYHGTAGKFAPRAIILAWSDKRIRLAIAGYLGHMWELYAMWAWIGVASAVSYGMTMVPADAEYYAKLTAFLAIGIGAIVCVFAGLAADRIGKAQISIIAMAVSGSCALGAAGTFGGPPWLTFLIVMVWGVAIIPDSAQFSALVADAAPRELAGSLMTLQTALGFALTIFTVQMTPVLAASMGWPFLLSLLALGPALGIAAMVPLCRKN